MAGLVSEYDDLFFIAVMVIFAPITLIVGIGAFLANLGASGWVILLVTLFNIGLVAYFVHRWNLIESLTQAFQDFRTV